jgi:ATP-dependent RNA helicase DDX55/SPB4
VCSLVFVLI